MPPAAGIDIRPFIIREVLSESRDKEVSCEAFVVELLESKTLASAEFSVETLCLEGDLFRILPTRECVCKGVKLAAEPPFENQDRPRNLDAAVVVSTGMTVDQVVGSSLCSSLNAVSKFCILSRLTIPVMSMKSLTSSSAGSRTSAWSSYGDQRALDRSRCIICSNSSDSMICCSFRFIKASATRIIVSEAPSAKMTSYIRKSMFKGQVTAKKERNHCDK